jgi:hypothetical protein
VHFQIAGDRAFFYRGVDTAEYTDWLAHGVLRPYAGGTEFGKHLATTPGHALEWRRILPTKGDDSPPRVLQVSLPLDVANLLDFLGSRTDGIGPAYFASFKHLEVAIITEVPI